MSATASPSEPSRPTAEAPAPPPAAVELFGNSLAGAQAFVDLLAGEGITRGVLGPREVPRLWDRHVLNCGYLAELIVAEARVTDVGSGAGLPGIVLALLRPDLAVSLVEPLERRTQFLELAVSDLGLSDRVQVVRGRAQEPSVRERAGEADAVVSRAVAPLDRLVQWCLPLARRNGVVLALKGKSAATEVAEHAKAIATLGGLRPEVVSVGNGPAATWVVRVARGEGRSRERTGR